MARNIDNHTSITYGLSAKEVNQRIEAGFSNQQSNQETKSYQDIFRDNIFTLFNLINAILAGLIIFIGSFKNLLFLGVVVSNLVIGIVQELRAKKVLDRLRLITQPYLSLIHIWSFTYSFQSVKNLYAAAIIHLFCHTASSFCYLRA